MTGNAALTTATYGSMWGSVLSQLQQQFGEATFKSWFKSLELVEVEGGQVTLTAPTRFIREWVIANYADHIKRMWQQQNPSIQKIEIYLRATVPSATPVEPSFGIEGENVKMLDVPVLRPEDDFSSPLDPRFTFDNFVTGSSNELAYAAARAIAESPRPLSESNPLYMYGGVGLGKTHLMHAIAWHIRKNSPNRRVLYLSAEKFMYLFVSALRNKDILSFKDRLRSVDVLMIDDVQFIGGKDSTQDEFFHTFNALIDNKRQLIITGDRSPTDLDGMEERIRSRLGWGLVADIHTTTYELRLGILHSKLEQMHITIPQKVLEFLAHKITSNVRELEGALNKVVAHCSLTGRAVTLEGTQEILHDLLRANQRVITIEEIQRKVAEHFNIRVADMSSSRRLRAVARPRQVAMYLSKLLTSRSLPDIGRKFGGKDHTTVMHAVKKVEQLCNEDKELCDDVEMLKRSLSLN